MDRRFFGMPYFIDHIERQLRSMTRADVNRAIRKYLQTDHFAAVVVTGDAAAFRKRLIDDRPSPIVYAQAMPEEVLEADTQIAALPIRLADVRIIPIEQTFSRAAVR
jgi:hypothetical protein